MQRRIEVDEKELEFSFIRATGPGGQNVNKVSTAVQLRFDVAASPSLPDDVKGRFMRLAGSKMTTDGVLVMTARRHRTQEGNRRDALMRLQELLDKAVAVPKPRSKTKPTLGSKKRRLEEKQHRARLKSSRNTPGRED